MVEEYAGQPVTFLAVNGFSAGDVDPVANVENWISRYGWTFDVATDHPQYGVFTGFAGYKDSFFVIDGQGKVTLRLDPPNSVNSAFPVLRGAIDQALATVPVRSGTWGAIKRNPAGGGSRRGAP